MGRYAPLPQHDMDEAASDPAVAIHVRVDGLELRVCQGGLGDSRQVISRDEGDQVVEKCGNMAELRREAARDLDALRSGRV